MDTTCVSCGREFPEVELELMRANIRRTRRTEVLMRRCSQCQVKEASTPAMRRMLSMALRKA